MGPARCLTTTCKYIITRAGRNTHRPRPWSRKRMSATAWQNNTSNKLPPTLPERSTPSGQGRPLLLGPTHLTSANKQAHTKCTHRPGGSVTGSEPPLCISSPHPQPAPALRRAAPWRSDWLSGSQEGGPQCLSDTSELLWGENQDSLVISM